MAGFTIGEITKQLGAEAAGDLSLTVTSVQEPQSAGRGALALAMDESYANALQSGDAESAIIWAGADWQALGLKAAIFAPRSRYVLSGVSYVFEKKPEITAGIHPSAIIDPSAVIGENPSIGPFVIIGAGAKIGANVRILSHSSVSENAIIGDDALLYQGVRVAGADWRRVHRTSGCCDRG